MTHRVFPRAQEMNSMGHPSKRYCQHASHIRRHFHKSLAKVRLPRVKFHSLRHSYASLQLLSGTHPKVVQEALGHSSIERTLDTYSHLLPNFQKEAADKIDSLFRKP